MLRLTLILVAGMLLALLTAGEDRGQLRPGLARAVAEADAAPEPAKAAGTEAAADEVVRVVEAPVAKRAPAAKVAPVAAVAVAAPVPEPRPVREVVQEVEEVFTLSNLPTETPPAAPEPVAEGVEGQILYVTAASVNVRDGPSTEASVLGKLGAGEAALVVADVDGEWARIVIQGDGMEGYVALRFLGAEAP